MYKEAGGRRNRGDMRGQADTRLKNTTVGMLRKSCCCEMGWWGYAKRKELRILRSRETIGKLSVARVPEKEFLSEATLSNIRFVNMP